MAGPSFNIIVSLQTETDKSVLTKKIQQIARDFELGVRFGLDQIRELDPEEALALESLSREFEQPLVLTVTSRPSATDAFDLFESQLNIWRGANPGRSSFLRFLKDVWAGDEVREAIFTIWDSMIPSAGSPRRDMAFDEFIEWLSDYYRTELSRSGHGGAQGIFRVKK